MVLNGVRRRHAPKTANAKERERLQTSANEHEPPLRLSKTGIMAVFLVLSVTQLLHALSFVLSIISHQKSVLLSTKFHLHYTKIFCRNYFSLRVIVLVAIRLMRRQHLGITRSLVTHPKCFEAIFLAKITRKTAEHYTTKLLGI